MIKTTEAIRALTEAEVAFVQNKGFAGYSRTRSIAGSAFRRIKNAGTKQLSA